MQCTVALRRVGLLLFGCLLLPMACSWVISPSTVADRDPLTRPFAPQAIWNLPLGADALLRDTDLSAETVTITPVIVVLAADAPLVPVRENDSWQNTRCELTGAVQISVPLPAGYVVPGVSPEGGWDANPAAILRADGHTFEQLEPFARCDATRAATAIKLYPPIDSHDEQGIIGGHLGSGLSVLGGTIRLGELSPEHGRIRHAVKLALPTVDLSPSGAGIRWPATAPHAQWKTLYTGEQPALQPGALLALPMSFDSEALQSPAGRQIGWTLRHFGAYVVQDSSKLIHLFVESGPDGNVRDEYEANWDGSLDPADERWRADMNAIVVALKIVDNWTEALYDRVAGSGGTEGAGGGTPLASWLSPLR